ncbi:hypothetical protein [Globicatella sulfidifaciens]|uniref:Uncharacterized protein n=1 Tax=Globicatella sulfidifaciens TaxID=136093 RepID=A0A7X8H0C3_9LACT|nr:hypothetical protein [Globicatella sulfidifaciens]NLJ18371.1 hypothetical protein [Globicatella sulfidifaciens]
MGNQKVTGRITPVAKMRGVVDKSQSVHEKDYEKLINKPKINEVELKGDKSFEELGMKPLTNTEIAKMFN